MPTLAYDPWKHIPSDLIVVRVKLYYFPAYTTRGVIWLDDSLTTVEARCALTHELVHHERGHVGHQKAGVEKKVRYETALRLVPDLAYPKTDIPVRLVADEYDVTERVMKDRIEIMRAEAAASQHSTMRKHAEWCVPFCSTQKAV